MLAVACSGAQDPPPPAQDPLVSQASYCARTGTSFCNCVGVGQAACVEVFNLGCMQGKDPNGMSDRTESQTQTCERALSTGCTAALAGNIPAECPQLPIPKLQ